MKSFDVYLERSMRKDGRGIGYVDAKDGNSDVTADWSEHYVDYKNLKRKLRGYVKRRKALRKLCHGGVFLSEEDWKSLMGELYDRGSNVGGDAAGVTAADAGGYFRYSDDVTGKAMGGGDVAAAVSTAAAKAAVVYPAESMQRLSRAERTDFCAALDKEIRRASTFYASLLDSVEGRLSTLDAHMLREIGNSGVSNSTIPTPFIDKRNDEGNNDEEVASSTTTGENEVEAEFESVGSDILEAFAFEVSNVTAIRQILLRYDAFIRNQAASGATLSEWHLMQIKGDGDDFFRSLFHLDRLEKLHCTYVTKLTRFHLRNEGFIRSAVVNPDGKNSFVGGFLEQFEMFRSVLDSSFRSMERAAGGHLAFRDRFIERLRQYFLVGKIRDGLALEPQFKIFIMKGRHLKKEMKRVVKWRMVRNNDISEDDEDDHHSSVDAGFGGIDPDNVVPLVLNLISCFLFMMNNYIIEPSSAYYANALGSSDAMSGIMIGAAPWFALISAVGYSLWTNHSYKQPILFAGCLMIVGNTMYANAYSYNSMGMCLIGRAITGLGAPRIINRRYVADATPFSLRTASSAAFATATALGAALGPGVAILVDMFEFEFHLPLLGKQTFNGMTGPGYLMALAWAIYTLFIIVCFTEPNRSGLDELRAREIKNDSPKSSSNSAPLTSKIFDDSDDDSDQEDGDSLGSKETISFSPEAMLEVKNENTSSPFYCMKHMTRAVALCMSLIFMKRIALESIVGSTSIVTKNRYGWSIKNVGTLHLVNGIIVIPVSIFAGWLSQYHEDRYLALWFVLITIGGMCFLTDLTDLVEHDSVTYNEGYPLAVGQARYIAGSLIAFSGIEACESFVASLMSKVVPSALAVGTFNSGLLATLVGTGGRAVGDLFITAMGLLSVRNLLNLLIIPGVSLMVLSAMLIRWNYDILAV